MTCELRNFFRIGILVLVLASAPASRGDWPQFRGTSGDGHVSSKTFPLAWSETNGVKWKTAIHGKAWSSPVVMSGNIWLTTATEDGRELSVLRLNARTGAIEQERKLFTVDNPQFCHKFNSYASPTPAVESGRLYVSFGSPGVACLEARSLKTIWERRDFVCNHYRGAGSSPTLVAGLVVLPFDGSDHQFLAALDKKTGKTVWQQDRSLDFKDLEPDGKPEAEGDFRKAYATAHLIRWNGQDQLLSQGAKAFYAYEPTSGRELWRVEERTAHSGGTRPVFGNGLAYFTTGWSKGQLLALRPGSKGEVLDANAEDPANGAAAGGLRLGWKSKRNVANKPSLVLNGSELFMIDDGGIASCLDASTGAEIWRERIGGNHSASPLLAAGRIYFLSEEGKTTVIGASRDFRVLAQNQLGDGCMASPAADGSALILRSRSHLYRIEDAIP